MDTGYGLLLKFVKFASIHIHHELYKYMVSDAPDASDWAHTSIPELSRFESHLQCPICRELLARAPTITECGHTYCNECISRHIRTENRCPLCRQEIQQGKLRLNKIIDDLIETWTSSDLRGKLLKLAKQNEAQIPPESKRTHTGLDNNNNNEESFATGKKRSFASDPELAFAVDSANRDERLPASSSGSSSTSQDIPAGYSVCPVCSDVLPIDVIQGPHIMKCLNGGDATTPLMREPTQKNTADTKLSPRKKRAVFAAPVEEVPKNKLPVPSLYAMSETKIRAKLRESGLSLKGSKAQMISRYVEWVTIWNSSVNERHPRSIKELQRQMQTWDKQQDAIAQKGGSNLKELDSVKWSDKNKDNFDELITQARASLKTKPRETSESKLTQG